MAYDGPILAYDGASDASRRGAHLSVAVCCSSSRQKLQFMWNIKCNNINRAKKYTSKLLKTHNFLKKTVAYHCADIEWWRGGHWPSVVVVVASAAVCLRSGGRLCRRSDRNCCCCCCIGGHRRTELVKLGINGSVNGGAILEERVFGSSSSGSRLKYYITYLYLVCISFQRKTTKKKLKKTVKIKASNFEL